MDHVRRTSNNYFISQLIAFLMVLLFLSAAWGGSSPLTKHEYDETEKVGYFDLVINMDWKPEEEEKEGRLKNAFEQFAKDVFKMTEGKQKLRKLYVFTNNQQSNTADIKFRNVGGRSYAHAGGIFNKGAYILTYTKFSGGADRTDSYIGNTMAHEFGHYAYFLFDEYAEAGRAESARPSQPLSGDNPRPTIMNRQGDYQWFSTSEDYKTEAEQKTAHWRIYQASAWDTLVGDPKDDKTPNNFVSKYSRVRWKPFEGMTASTVLTKPTEGWDSKFEIIWMEGVSIVLVIDVSGSMGWSGGDAMAAAINASNQFVDLMNLSEQVAIVPFNSSASVLTPITLLKKPEDKNVIKSQISSLRAGGGTNFTAALNTTRTILDVEELKMTNRIVIFMSDGIAGAPDTSWYQENSIPIYTIGLGSGIQPSVLQAIASDTGGFYLASPSNDELANVYARARGATAGSEAVVASGEKELIYDETVSYTTTLGAGDGFTRFRASWSAGQINFTLKSPDGTEITPESLPQRVNYTSGPNYAFYEVEIPDAGDWISKIILTQGTQAGLTHTVSTQSPLSVGLELTGGESYPEPIGMLVSLSGPEPVIEAEVSVTVSSPSGETRVVELRDDGVAPDFIPNDGVYSGVFAGYVENGEYSFDVKVSNPEGRASYDTSGSLEAGDDAPAEKLPPFIRQASDTITISNVTPMPEYFQSAQTIIPDNTPVWGAIIDDFEEVWYKFDAVQDTRYFIQTSQLLSWDSHEMATLVQLYDTEADTLLDQSEYYDGTNVSYINWVAPEDGTYYLRVLHASPGTGSYAVSVGEKSLFTTIYETTYNEDNVPSRKKSSSSGCFINTITQHD